MIDQEFNKLDPWMKGPCEIRANGYIYPCEVVKRVALGKENYLVKILLPNDVQYMMVVEKNIMMSRAHYNPTFDNAKKEKSRREEFLYPVGSFVKTKLHDKKISGIVIKYNPDTAEYIIKTTDEISTYGIHRREDQLKLDKKRTAEEKEKRIQEMIVPNREQPVESVKVTVSAIPQFEAGEHVFICTNKSGGKETWMPGIIVREDTGNPYIPMSGSRWFITFSNRAGAFEWSYPADRIKKLTVEKPEEKEAKENTKDELKDKFNTGDRVEIVRGIFQGDTGVIVKKYEEVIKLKDNFWTIEMDGTGNERIVNERNLKLYVNEQTQKDEEVKEDEDPRKSEEKTYDDFIGEMREVFNGFFKIAESAIKEDSSKIKIDFKKFIDGIGPIKEYLGKQNKKD